MDSYINFSKALQYLKKGKKLRRYEWSNKDLYIAIKLPAMRDSDMTLPYIYIEHFRGNKCPWVPNQIDLLADDWYVLQ